MVPYRVKKKKRKSLQPSHWSLLIHPLPISASLVGTTAYPWPVKAMHWFPLLVSGRERKLFNVGIDLRINHNWRILWFDILSLWVLLQYKTFVFIPPVGGLFGPLFIRTRGGKENGSCSPWVRRNEHWWSDPSSCIPLLRVSFLVFLVKFRLTLYSRLRDFTPQKASTPDFIIIRRRGAFLVSRHESSVWEKGAGFQGGRQVIRAAPYGGIGGVLRVGDRTGDDGFLLCWWIFSRLKKPIIFIFFGCGLRACFLLWMERIRK